VISSAYFVKQRNGSPCREVDVENGIQGIDISILKAGTRSVTNAPERNTSQIIDLHVHFRDLDI